VPLVCLVESSAAVATTATATAAASTTASTTVAASTAASTTVAASTVAAACSSFSNHGDSSNPDISSDHSTLSTRDMTVNCSSGSAADCASAVHPIVSALNGFVSSPPWGRRDGITLTDQRKDKECWVFAMFTDDTNLPLSVHLRDALLTQLPQLPLFCLVSDCIVLPADALPYISTPDKPCPPSSHGISVDHEFSDAYKDLFIATLDSIRLQNWDFGRTFSSAVDVSTLSHQKSQSEELSGSLSYDSRVNGSNRVDWVSVREILDLPNVARILSVGHTHIHQSGDAFRPPDSCKAMIAGLIGGTVSFRQAACDSFPNSLRQPDGSDVAALSAVRNFLLEADLVRCSCYKAVTDGTLSLSRITVQSPQPFPDRTVLPVAQGRPAASASSSTGGAIVKQPTCVKWVVPWLCALSGAARSALKRPNIPQVTPHRSQHIDCFDGYDTFDYLR
jgi:hypothetical protein